MRRLTDLLSEDDLKAAFATEVGTRRRLIPPSSLQVALLWLDDEVAVWLHGSVSTDWSPSTEQVVAASKARHGVRPLALWDLPSTVAYRALSERLATTLPAPVRSGTAWAAFQREPLERAGAYIVSADIAACYQMLDHGELARELQIKSADGPTVERVVELLQAVGDRRYGLPQQSFPSDLLAETLLAALERRAVRKGLALTRYNDDFRINCTNWSDVVRAIEVLSEECRAMGFLLNDSKVLTYKRATYETKLDRADELRAEIGDEAEMDLTDYWEGYGGFIEVVEPEPEQVEHLTAVRVLERWQRVAGRGQVVERNRAEHIALVQLVPLALHELSKTKADAPGALDIVVNLLRYEQTTTPAVCEFLSTRNDGAALIAMFDKLLRRNTYLTGWQAWWLQQPLARLNLTKGIGAKRRIQWLDSLLAGSHHSPVLRANAARTLARQKLVTADDLLRLYDRSSDVERPAVVEAIALLKPAKPIREAITGDSLLHQWVFDWAVQHA